MVKKANYCNGCPDCISCGRNKYVLEEHCDCCDDIIEDIAYLVDSEVLCRDCAIEHIRDNAIDFLQYLDTKDVES